MSMHKEDYAAKGKEWFGNFMDDIAENMIVLTVGVVLGFLLAKMF